MMSIPHRDTRTNPPSPHVQTTGSQWLPYPIRRIPHHLNYPTGLARDAPEPRIRECLYQPADDVAVRKCKNATPHHSERSAYRARYRIHQRGRIQTTHKEHRAPESKGTNQNYVPARRHHFSQTRSPHRRLIRQRTRAQKPARFHPSPTQTATQTYYTAAPRTVHT